MASLSQTARSAPLAIPASIEEMDVPFLNRLIARADSEARIGQVRICEQIGYGAGEASTASRAFFDVTYAEDSPSNLPTRLVLKFARNFDVLGEAGIGVVYANEVRVYNDILPEVTIERPLVLGAEYDPATERFVLLMEDLTQRGATFRDSRSNATIPQLESLLDSLAGLHAAFWESPRFSQAPQLFETHVDGPLADYMTACIPAMVADELANEAFKRELLGDLGISMAELAAGLSATHRYHSRLPQTFLHGDPHIGNTYLLPDDRCGLLDWQLAVRGYCMHDVSYAVTTALPIDQRRKHERELVAYYLDRLAAHGVRETPGFDDAMVEFGRALVWGLYVGWLPCPVANYGWQVNVSNHLRLAAAFRDHETAKLVRDMI